MRSRPHHRRRAGARGLTLLELIIVMGILVLMIGVSVVGLGRMSSVQLRTQTNRLAAAVRFTYNRSVAHGLYMRMVIDLESDAYWVEASTTPVFLNKEKVEEGDALEAAKEEADLLDRLDDEEKKSFLARRSSFQNDGVIEKTTMERGIQIAGVLTSSQKDVFESGQAYIYFFPNGFVEPALIYTTDGDGAYYSLLVNPFTGKVTQKHGKVDPDREFGEPEKVEEEGR